MFRNLRQSIDSREGDYHHGELIAKNVSAGNP